MNKPNKVIDMSESNPAENPARPASAAGSAWSAIFAAATLAAIPTTIVLFACQRWIRGGLRAGALEG